MTRNEFTRQVEQLQGTLYRIAATVLAQPCDREDAVQSAILKAWQHLPRLREDDRFSPWLIRIMLNECYALLRRRKREIPVDTLPELPAPETGDPDLYRFFVNLPDKLRMVMVLSWYSIMWKATPFGKSHRFCIFRREQSNRGLRAAASKCAVMIISRRYKGYEAAAGY